MGIRNSNRELTHALSGVADNMDESSTPGRINGEEDEEGVETEFYLVSQTESIAYEDTTSDEENSDTASVACKWEGGDWVCRPYKREMISAEILMANRKGEKGHAAVLNLLQKSGVRVFVVDAKISSSIADIMKSIRSVIHHVSKLDRSRACFNPRLAQRCLLYKDGEGRFFNLTLAEYTTAPAGTFTHYLTSFSGIQAMSVLTILCRSFPCAMDSKWHVCTSRQHY
jgi:hypothetical protein